MNYVERMENVTVLGAAGKMGSGILLLTAIEMADLSLKPENKDRSFTLNAVDLSQPGLNGLMRFLKVQVQKAAEKKTVQLREAYKDRTDLIENADIINQYVFDVMNIVRPTTLTEAAYDSTLVFEAIIENPEIKVKVFKQIDQNNGKSPWFFTNTSSIPISELDSKAGLGGRVIGFHFYNPPAVQKLVEVIQADKTLGEVADFALAYAKNLRKTVVPSNDIAGFIGNGHFMRDALYGISEVERLSKEMPFVEALYTMNKVSQEFLVRPMGIFQLIDYVGVDVCRYIMSVMNPHLDNEDLHSALLDRMNEMGVKGGQHSDGSQKDGFLKYERGRPAGVYDPQKKAYVPFAEIQEKCDDRLGPLPKPGLPWKAVIGAPDRESILAAFFEEMKKADTMGTKLAVSYGKRSLAIGKQLVSDKVARRDEDVNTVLLTGFYHSYGPINNFFS